MTKIRFVIGCLLTLANSIRAHGAHGPQQQPWHLPSDAPSHSSSEQPWHELSSLSTIWSLSSARSHQQPFPSHNHPHPKQAGPAKHATGPSPFGNAVESNRSNDPLANAIPASLQWSLSNANGSIQVDALFPSLAHLDLLCAGIIQEPAIGLNEGLYRWIIDEPTWTYTADLTPVLEQISMADDTHQYWLYFQGLDTIAEVYVGGELVKETKNQYMWHAFPVPSHLLESRSDAKHTNLTLVFQNTNHYAAEQADQFDPGYPTQIESQQSRATDYEYPNRIFIRKQQSDFGWDWGPALVPVGPHKPAYLIALPEGNASVDEETKMQDGNGEQLERHAKSETFVLASAIDIYRKGQTNNLPPPDSDENWIVNVTLTLLSPSEVSYPSIRLSIPSLGLYTFDTLLSSPAVAAGLNQPVHAVFEIPSKGEYGPSLWWPRGHGEQKLYEVVVRSDELKFELHKKVGFRTAVFDMSTISPELVHQGVEPGSHFRLLINGKEVYVMGTNLIPFDTLSPRTNTDYLRWLLDSSLHVHINLIRIWGGGAYPSQEFLDLCDELGIMVWMDVMFAASLYPYHPEFLQEVEAEVRQVLVDVVTHPCIVTVVGNNEGELYFLGGYGRRKEDVEWKRGYELLFDKVVRDAVLEASGGLSYIPCSTTTGYLSLNPYKARYDNYPKDKELHGTGEHYGYDASLAFDIDTYPRSRFMVEFGMFSLPSLFTLDRILPPPASSSSDYAINSTVLRAHLKHPPAGNLSYPFAADQGQHELVSAIDTYFPSPSFLSSKTISPRENLHRWSYSSQLYQSIYITSQISVYRRSASLSERNRGLIVWQLNDVWQGTSWSSIEYGGRWKMVHYGLAKVQAPISVVSVYNQTKDELEIGVVFSNPGVVDADGKKEEEEEIEVRMEWFDFTGRRLGQKEEVHVSLKSDQEGGGIGYPVAKTFNRPTETICEVGGKGCFLRLTLILRNALTDPEASPHELPLRSKTTTTTTYWTPMTDLKSTLTDLSIQTGLRPRIEIRRAKAPTTTNQTSSNDEKTAYSRWTIEVLNRGDAVAPYIFVEHGGGDQIGFFADGQGRPENGFWLEPHTSKALSFRRPRRGARKGLAHQLQMRPDDAQQEQEQEDYDDEAEWFRSLHVSNLFDNLDAAPSP